MRLPNSAHTSRPWRIHEIAQTSASRTCGRCRLLVVLTTSRDWCNNSPSATRRTSPPGSPERSSRSAGSSAQLLGWDDPESGVGSRVPTLRERLPVDLRDGPSGPDSTRSPSPRFT